MKKWVNVVVMGHRTSNIEQASGLLSPIPRLMIRPHPRPIKFVEDIILKFLHGWISIQEDVRRLVQELKCLLSLEPSLTSFDLCVTLSMSLLNRSLIQSIFK